ncbi:MAG: family radical protein [Sphingobacterium sp.]|jgi:radical SAM protein (TIGR01212 family)|uniref:TIGR01212 family radical SAM protein n=1 Tax=unclassified Sphingobacterium TaxID=2609468 RepID=UPI0009850CE2|nr:TIGR01212 family radical SAM protein [Sphingobacterium sp. CZ-UAM]MDF2518624.1 family radical protein [Sphingobacterium sp.]OOG17293.1 TIGR01212 family radical SAM protein [Sphingobacterium sp. CZ-UAM]
MGTLLDNGIKPYNHYGAYLKQKYNGQKVFKVIVDGNFTCPNRDGSKGYGGCTYCNVDSFTPDTARKIPSIREQVESGIERARNSYGAEKFIIYFQPNTNTYAPTHLLKMMYDEALSIDPENTLGLSVGTRPDCLDFEKIALLESYTDRYDVDLEMGMESIYNDTLDKINRGCSHDEFVKTMDMLKDTPLELCVHTIFGFPWETEEMMLKYADEINRFPQIKFVKLHHLHIVEGSIMGVKYKREPFELFSMEGYTDFLSKFIPRLRSDLIIQRIFGIADKELLIAPNWGLPKSGIQTYIDKGLEARKVVQGSLFQCN